MDYYLSAMYLVECDRCGILKKCRRFTEGKPIPEGIVELDGEHLCEDCYQEFRSFMDDKVAKIKVEVKPSTRAADQGGRVTTAK